LTYRSRSRSSSEEPGRRAAYHRPALAPAPVPSAARPGPKTRSCQLAVPRPVPRPMPQAVPLRPQAPLNLSTGRQVRPVRLCALAASSVRDPGSCAPPGSEEPAGFAASARVGRTFASGSVSAPGRDSISWVRRRACTWPDRLPFSWSVTVSVQVLPNSSKLQSRPATP
jgi:hypothetical protein